MFEGEGTEGSFQVLEVCLCVSSKVPHLIGESCIIAYRILLVIKKQENKKVLDFLFVCIIMYDFSEW
jgi:hypothetical protein